MPVTSNPLRVIEPDRLDGPRALVAQLRALADEIETGNDVRTIAMVMDKMDNTVDLRVLGYRPRKSEAAGLLAYGQHLALEGNEG